MYFGGSITKPHNLGKDLTSEDVNRAYRSLLGELTRCSQAKIESLTRVAQSWGNYASVIVNAIEQELKNAESSRKLALIYLIDSILKKVRGDYSDLFLENITSTFYSAFHKMDLNNRVDMYNLRKTWNSVLPPHVLNSIDFRCNAEDGTWPYNPYLKNIRDRHEKTQLEDIDEKKELRRTIEEICVQKRKLELDLEAERTAKRKMEELLKNEEKVIEICQEPNFDFSQPPVLQKQNSFPESPPPKRKRAPPPPVWKTIGVCPQIDSSPVEIPESSCYIHEECRTIKIGGKRHKVRYYGDTAIVFLDNCSPRTVYYEMDSKTNLYLSINKKSTFRVFFDTSSPRPLVLRNDQGVSSRHRIRVTGSARDLYIDGKCYRALGPKPIKVKINDQMHSLQFVSSPPDFQIGTVERFDIVAGMAYLNFKFENQTRNVPIWLDDTLQLIDLKMVNYPIIVRFWNEFRSITVNGITFPVKFGGPSTPILFGTRKCEFGISAISDDIKIGINRYLGSCPSPCPSPRLCY